MNEIQIANVNKCECGNTVEASMKFCPQCGHHFRALRSENEIRIELEKIKAWKNTDKEGQGALVKLMMLMCMTISLDWTLGSKMSPFEFLTASKKEGL